MARFELASELLTPAEAAIVSAVDVRDVNRVIDEDILPKSLYVTDHVRRLRAAACPFINFYFHTAESLTSELRSDVIDFVFKRDGYEKAFEYLVLVEIKKPSTEHFAKASELLQWLKKVPVREIFTLNFDLFFEDSSKRYGELLEARDLVVEDPEILSGTPIIRGTRVPVYDVAASLEKGITTERLLAAYPSLNERMITMAKLYAASKPLRGRPKVSAKTPTLRPGRPGRKINLGKAVEKTVTVKRTTRRLFPGKK